MVCRVLIAKMHACRVLIAKMHTCSFARLFAKSIALAGNSKVTFQSSSQAATCYYLSNHSKVEAILFRSELAKGVTLSLGQPPRITLIAFFRREKNFKVENDRLIPILEDCTTG